MAKIAKITVQILGEFVELPVNCSSKGLFSTVYPASILGSVKTVNSFRTRAELEEEIRTAVAEVNSLATTVEDLILYRVGPANKNPYSTGDSQACSISLEYAAVRIKRTGLKVELLQIHKYPFDSNDPYGLPKNWIAGSRYSEGSGSMGLKVSTSERVPFTPEAYSFFEKMKESIRALGEKMSEVLTPETVTEFSQKGFLPVFVAPELSK